ncbi:GNAT family N-acetyltransferase [Streptomyces sp. NPDC059411]|uniref:GNAT family N-acetyltransferase n=1 Tax=Streptomyces sp. NPDC059411 TaxID=3346825 RepID=UPI00367C51C2
MITPVTLRDLLSDDAPAIQRIYSGESVAFTTGKPITIEEAADKISSWGRDAFGITVHGDLIGVVKIHSRTASTGSISYILREDSWGRGYATEAVRQIVDFAFNIVCLERLEAKHHPDNPASGRVLAKAGFTCHGLHDDFVSYALEKERTA